MPRGGRRSGKPGANYQNRSDLQMGARKMPNQPFPTGVAGGTYGSQAASQRSQALVPVQGSPQPTAGLAGPQAGTQPGSAGPVPMGPESVPNISDPTRRPNEPIEAGLPFGPGPGPAMGTTPIDDIGARIRALYLASPTQELRELLSEMELG